MYEYKMFIHNIKLYLLSFCSKYHHFSSKPNNYMQGGKCGLICSMNFRNIFIHLLALLMGSVTESQSLLFNYKTCYKDVFLGILEEQQES